MIVADVGTVFGYLEVVRLNRSESRGSSWLCRCICGDERVYSAASLQGGKTYRPIKSCGCKAYAHKGAIMENKRLHSTWYLMVRRCHDPKADNYARYGGSGITVTEEWKNDFLAFREWSLLNGYIDDLTIDRIDSEKPYSPENCRWVDYYVQMQNRGMMGNNTSGVNGVSFNKKTGKYGAYITRNKVKKNLGSFSTVEDASEARSLADRYFKEHGTLENL